MLARQGAVSGYCRCSTSSKQTRVLYRLQSADERSMKTELGGWDMFPSLTMLIAICSCIFIQTEVYTKVCCKRQEPPNQYSFLSLFTVAYLSV